jgi:hypothetical protein
MSQFDDYRHRRGGIRRSRNNPEHRRELKERSAMPVIRHDNQTLEVGDYYVNVRTGAMVEIMEVDLSGNCRVLDVKAALDAPWQMLTHSQISSCLWRLVASDGHSEDLPRAA